MNCSGVSDAGSSSASTRRGVAPEFGPEVAHQVRLTQRHALERPGVEVALPFPLPARPQRLRPLRVGRRVVAFVDGRRGALKDVEVLGVSGQERDDLDRGGAGADDGDALVGELVQVAAAVAAGVVVVPPRRVERVALEVLDPRNAGQFGPVEGARRQHHEPGADVVAAVGADSPALDLLVPTQIAHLGGEDRRIVEAEMLADVAAVLVNLGAVGELLRRHEIELFEKRDVAVGFVVALDARVPVPVPDTAEVAAEFDHAYVVDARLLQVGRRQQSTEAATEDRDVDVLRNQVAWRGRGVGIDLVVPGEVVLQFDVLLGTFLAQPLFAFQPVLLAQRGDVDVVGRLGGPAAVLVHGHADGDSLRDSSWGSPVPMYLDNW